MRKYVPLGLLTTFFILLLAGIGRAQSRPPVPVDSAAAPEQIIRAGQMIDGVAPPPPPQRETAADLTPRTLTAEAPADECVDATLMTVTAAFPGEGGEADTILFTSAANDPDLNCMFGFPSRPEGYRTAWYRLNSGENGRVKLDTFSSGYDTVLAVYTGECGELVQIACNDDFNGFSSEVVVDVSEAGSYLVEIADWHQGIVNTTELRLSALLLPVVSFWKDIATSPFPPALSRHATVVDGGSIYVIGGQSGGILAPDLTNALSRFDTGSRDWTELANMPGPGYSNTTAALVNGRIYLPAGYNGNIQFYDGVHWSYDIGQNNWTPVSSIPNEFLPHGTPYAWSAAVVPPSNNRYYLTGGLSSSDPLSSNALVIDQTLAYTPEGDLWSRLAPMQAPRFGHTADWIEANGLGICVAGGLGIGTDEMGATGLVLHRSAECYQPGGTWRFIGDLQVPRYGAGSAVGPDGRWYVFGGLTVVNGAFRLVRETEVYDPLRGTWSLLPPSYNLGDGESIPARFWPRGETVGNDLWVIGGSIFTPDEAALPVVERLYLPSDEIYFPYVTGTFDEALRPDENFSQAWWLPFNEQLRRRFIGQRDFFDNYFFDLPLPRQVKITLGVPDDNDFDLAIYGGSKLLWGSSDIPFNGADEEITIDLPANRYYVVVTRAFPTEMPDPDGYYTLTLE